MGLLKFSVISEYTMLIMFNFTEDIVTVPGVGALPLPGGG